MHGRLYIYTTSMMSLVKWWSHCLWQASPRWPWWWPVWPRPSSCCSRWGSFLLLGPAATVPRQLVPTSWMGSTTTRGAFCKKKQSLLDNTVITNSNTKLHDFVLLMYQFCNSHQTYDTVVKESFLPQTGYKETHLSSNTMNKWFSYFRLLCMRAQKKVTSKIEGGGDIVEMDETMQCAANASTGRSISTRQPKGRRLLKPRSSLMRRTRIRRMRRRMRTWMKTWMTKTLRSSISLTASAARQFSAKKTDLVHHASFCEVCGPFSIKQ